MRLPAYFERLGTGGGAVRRSTSSTSAGVSSDCTRRKRERGDFGPPAREVGVVARPEQGEPDAGACLCPPYLPRIVLLIFVQVRMFSLDRTAASVDPRDSGRFCAPPRAEEGGMAMDRPTSRSRSLVLAALLGATLRALLAPSEARGATIVVPTNAATIQQAVDLAAPGDVVRVLPGTYPGPVRIVGAKAGLTIEGADPHSRPCSPARRTRATTASAWIASTAWCSAISGSSAPTTGCA
jgi:hypothetical protein